MSDTARDIASGGAPVEPARTRIGQWWMDAPVRRKLLSVVLLIALLCVPALVIGATLSSRLSEGRQQTRAAAEKVEQLSKLQSSLLEAVTAMENYLSLGLADPAYVDDYRAAAIAIPGEVAEVRDGLPEELIPDARELADAVGALLADAERVIAFGESRPNAAQNGRVRYPIGDASMYQSLIGSTAAAYESVELLDKRFDDRLDAQRHEVDRLRGLLVWTTLGSLVFALAGAAVGIIIVTGGIVRRLEEVSLNGERFLRNEPLQPMAASADEIGQLANRTLVAGEIFMARQAQAEAATRAKDEFLSRVSHDLKTPLATMIGSARRLDEDPSLSDDNREDLAHISSASAHLQGLIQEMLDIKAIEAGELSLAIEPIPVHDAVDDAVGLIQTMAADHVVRVTMDCPDDLTVAADRRRVREVLLNLLSNAVKYNHEGGRVDVAAASQDSVVHVAVTDTGPGITPEDQQHLFKPFERLKAADTAVEGSGIGLSLTKHVVEAMGGTIGVDSTPGEGSTFWFDLPAPTAPDGTRPAPPTAPPAAVAPTPTPPPTTQEGARARLAGGMPLSTEGEGGVIPPAQPARTRFGRWWLNLRVRVKLLSIVPLVALVCLPPLTLVLTLNARLVDARSDEQVVAENAAELDTLRSSLRSASESIRSYLLTGLRDSAAVGTYREVVAEVPDQYAALRDDLPGRLDGPARRLDAAMQALIEDLEGVTEFGVAGSQVANVTTEPGYFELNPSLARKLSEGVDDAVVLSDAFAVLERELDQTLGERRDEVDRLQGQLVWATIATMVAALLAAVGGTFVVAKGIVGRIERLSDNSERFLRGQEVYPSPASTDEVGQLTGQIRFAGELLAARQAQTEAATRAKDEFHSRVSHELKTPLTAIIGFAQMLDEDPDLSPENRDEVGRIIRAGNHLHGLIQDMLDIKSIEAGKLALDLEPVRVRGAIDDALANVHALAADRSITIAVDCPPDTVVTADARRLREVLAGALESAVKQSRVPGRVQVAVTPEDGGVRLAVRDSGRGLTRAERERLFAPLENLHAADTSARRASVGLSLAKYVVEAMGGTIGVDSTPGEGSTFWFVLPAGPPGTGTEPATGR